MEEGYGKMVEEEKKKKNEVWKHVKWREESGISRVGRSFVVIQHPGRQDTLLSSCTLLLRQARKDTPHNCHWPARQARDYPSPPPPGHWQAQVQIRRLDGSGRRPWAQAGKGFETRQITDTHPRRDSVPCTRCWAQPAIHRPWQRPSLSPHHMLARLIWRETGGEARFAWLLSGRLRPLKLRQTRRI